MFCGYAKTKNQRNAVNSVLICKTSSSFDPRNRAWYLNIIISAATPKLHR